MDYKHILVAIATAHILGQAPGVDVLVVRATD